MPQASPDLAIALSREYRFGEELANFHHQILIGVHLRATLLWLPQPLLPLASGIEAGSRQLPDRGHSRHTIRLITGRRKCAAHAFDFHDTKGRPFSRRAIFSRNNSFSTLTVATTDFKRRFSSSSASISRLIRPSSPLARKRSRHSVSVAIVTRCLREVLSKSAPRNSSRMTDTLRLADHRPAPGSGPNSADCSVALRAPSAAPESALFVLDMLISPSEHFLYRMFPARCPTKFW